MRVLHLAPPATTSQAITAHSFIDEELRALGNAGVACFALSERIEEPELRDGVQLIPMERPSMANVARTLGVMAGHARLVPRPSIATARSLFHSLRIEQTAACAVEEWDIDLVHSHFGWPGGFGGTIAAAEAGVPLIASLRGMDLLQRRDLAYGLRQDPLYDRLICQLVARADVTLYATEFMRSAGLAAGARDTHTVVVRKGVDLARFRPSADVAATRDALGVRGPLILAVGTLRPLKNYPFLFAALATLTDLEWTLVVCGEGPDRAALEQYVAEHGLQDRVRFTGTVGRDRIGAYFAAADVFVHASAIEAAGNVVLEALAAGCAVVAADSGGPGEHLVDGETGFLVSPQDQHALAARLRQVLEQPELRQRLSVAARRDAERRFDYRRMIADFVDVYRRVAQVSR